MVQLRCLILTVSDTCSAGKNQDTSGPYLVEAIKRTFEDIETTLLITPDDVNQIERLLLKYSESDAAHLIITTGGTGFTQRDVTPEATRKVIDKEAPGIPTAICIKSLRATEMAMLSRGVCGIRNKTLIINFPGSLKAVKECYAVVENILPHSLDQILGETCKVKAVHAQLKNKDELPKSTKPVCHHKKQDVSQVAYRKRESSYQMIEVTDAVDFITQAISCIHLSSEEVPLQQCLNRVLWGTVNAAEPYPPFPASTKDGYACRSEDGTGLRRVRDAVVAGDEGGLPLLPGECSRISTGAPVPPGADCIVQVEDTKLIDFSEDGTIEFNIEVMVKPSAGQDIRQIGSDIKVNEELLSPGTVIGPAELGLLCTLGVRDVCVYSEHKIGVLSSGNELQHPHDADLKPGHIRDSNKSMLMALLGQYVECVDLGIAIDDVNSLKNALSKGFETCNIIISTGGVSMGERDLLKTVLIEHFDGKIIFGRVNMKPGKPMVLTQCGNGNIVFALPGNPVSAFVTSHLFVIPALKLLSGRDKSDWPKINVEVDEDIPLDIRPEYARANFSLEAKKILPLAKLTGNQISSRLASAVNAPLLLQLPSSSKAGPVLPKGSIVTALIIGNI